MSLGNKGLGRGLDALLGGVREEEAKGTDSSEILMVPVSNIIPNPHQPRRTFAPEALEDLAASISTRGVLQPVLVRPLRDGRYELVAGERRLRASKLAKLTEIPTLVREMTDQESLAIALIENLQREDLNPVEEALGYQQLQKQFGLSQDELARQVGKSRSAIANSLRLLNLPESIRTAIQDNEISAGHGRALMMVAEAEPQSELHRRIVENGLTVRQAEAQAAFWKEHQRLPGAEEVGKAGTARSRQAPRPLHPRLDAFQGAFSQQFGLEGLQMKMSGTPKKGRITIQYKDEETLRSFAEKLGITFSEE
ncbi:ParB/RepB/Spo0J family partition protein [Pseudodesulfovibrio tunisiensis]|uniref:ParB/RepB/Spo0J family partition protein n=1 Tax=Pseudodesulfovibrio tunisiensis TaxID=463192 RepID=UPI001FB46BB1|nr:ParB/RepB/Spo0J family partition protein [Pseudodesulfovibrio tunisiensis]